MNSERPEQSILVRARPGMIAVVGAALSTSPHAHHAIQVTVQLAARHRFRIGDRDCADLLSVVPSDVPHVLQSPRCFILLVEPESDAGKAITRSGPPSDGTVPIVRALVKDLATTFTPGSLDLPWSAAEAVLRSLNVASPGERPMDDRVLRAIELLDRFEAAGAWEAVPLARVAKMAYLSADRFRHVFRRETGLSWRRYLLWRRLIGAIRAIADDESVVEAAYSAGFSDGSHLTRTCRAMFGVPPSVLAKVGRFIQD